MNSYTIRTLMDTSLFCKQPCILVTFFLDSSDTYTLEQHEQVIHEIVCTQLAEIGIDVKTDNKNPQDNLPFSINLIINIALEVMLQLDLNCGPVTVSGQNDNTNRLFVAFPEKNRIWTTQILTQVINFVLNIHLKQNKNATMRISNLCNNLKKFINNSARLTKTRATKDIQGSLLERDTPWFALDYNLYSTNLFQIGFGRQQQVLQGCVKFESSHLGVQTTVSKMKTLQFLSQLGFPTPKQMLIKTAQEANKVASDIGFPVVLKADIGTHGNRVYADLRSDKEVTEVFYTLQSDIKSKGINHDSSILIENYIPGRIYRLEVIKEKFFDAYDMIPAGVIGDGKHTINELVKIENQKPSRDSQSEIADTFVALDMGKAELLMLKKQGLSIESIPAIGEDIRLRANSNWASGGTFKKVTECVHNDNQLLVERIAAALKIDILGIDLITDDISKSFIEEDLHIIEVNHAPNMGNYYDNERGVCVDNAARIIHRLAPDAAYGTVPVILFKDTALSFETENLFADILNNKGYCAGLINKQGLNINGLLWSKPEQVNYQNPGLQLLRNNSVGAAIINKSSEDLANFGLGTGGCDIAVILNCRNKKIVTPIWPDGLSVKKIDHLLLKSSRLASILFVENTDGVELCHKGVADKIFPLFMTDFIVPAFLVKSNTNYIKLLKHTEKGLLLNISYKQDRYEKWLTVPAIINPLPYMAKLAVLLILGLDIDEG